MVSSGGALCHLYKIKVGHCDLRVRKIRYAAIQEQNKLL